MNRADPVTLIRKRHDYVTIVSDQEQSDTLLFRPS